MKNVYVFAMSALFLGVAYGDMLRSSSAVGTNPNQPDGVLSPRDGSVARGGSVAREGSVARADPAKKAKVLKLEFDTLVSSLE